MLEVGVDIIVGLLIKNFGGGLVKIGGYIVGKEVLVDLCGYCLIIFGIGREVGVLFYSLLEMY